MQPPYTALEPTILNGLGIRPPSLSVSDASFYATSTFVYGLFFVGILLAAFYGYTLAGIWRMQASQESITKSNEKFKKVTLGLLGVFSLFLIIFTVNKDLLIGDVGLGALQAQRGGATTVTTLSPGTGPVAPSPTTPPPAAGQISSSIASSAARYRGTSTANAPGTMGGRLACAYAVNEVLKGAGIAPLGSLSVLGMESALRVGRGTLVRQSDAVPGDIAIEAGAGHVGICLDNGCTQVLSNSSSNASFTWVSRPDFLPSYKNGAGRIYRVTK